MTIFTTIGGLLKNPIWRAKNTITYIGDAQAPTLWDFDSDGFASPSNERVMSPVEAEFMEQYNIQRARMTDASRRAIDTVLKDVLPTATIEQSCNRNFQAARNWTAPRDPLILDLDSDGIETLGINPAAPILFDMDGDGTKTATGWIKADDGIVVLDRNGNGLIDSGRELFGDSTVLTRGPRAGQTAANGYEALADLDINGDGAINSLDAAYSSLRIWQDINQDGISQANELRKLSDVGIASISVAGQASNVNLVDSSGQATGNTQPFSGSFTRTNGSTGASGVAEVSGSLLLASNNFYREFTDNPVVTTAAQALPQMQGSGKVRDLRQAMSFGGVTPSVNIHQIFYLIDSWSDV